MTEIDLTGRIAIVTGASRGIGAAIAKSLAASGANLILNAYSNKEMLNDLAATLSKEHGTDIDTVIADVSNPNDCLKLVKLANQKFKRLDILVNNAGILRDGLIGMISQSDLDSTIDINLKAVIYCTQAAARLMMRAERGTIVNISSIIGRFGNEGQMVYGATKAGVIGATKSAAKELAPKNIRVNAIAPGYIDTEMISAIPKNIHEERMGSIKMGRIGTAQDVANTALFLASDLSSYVTGQVIGVDGGMII